MCHTVITDLHLVKAEYFENLFLCI